jgi:anti-anti-sigma factor
MQDMAWKIKELEDGEGVVEVQGVVDSTNVDEFFAFLRGVYKGGMTRIVLDLEKTNYISSAGLSVIVDTYKKAEREGGKLVIARASDTISELFQLVQFEKIMEFYDNLQDAIGAIDRSEGSGSRNLKQQPPA